MHLTLGLWDIRDTQCGFKFFRGPVARDLFGRQRIDGYMFDIEILHLAERAGYRIKEVGVRWRDDADSRLDLVSGNWRNMIDILRIRFADYGRPPRHRHRSPDPAPVRRRLETGTPSDARRSGKPGRGPCGLCEGRGVRPFTRRGGSRWFGAAPVVWSSSIPCPAARRSTVTTTPASPRASSTTWTWRWPTGAASPSFWRSRRRSFPGREAVGPGLQCGDLPGVGRERGWDTQGLEINEEAAAFCRRERALDVRTGVLEHDTYAPESFDLVMMADVVEHLVGPFETLCRVARVLRPGGLVMISTPDIERWAARLLQVKPEEHLYYFSPATIRTALRQAGLETVRVQGYDRYHNLTAMVHSTTCGTLFQRLARSSGRPAACSATSW